MTLLLEEELRAVQVRLMDGRISEEQFDMCTWPAYHSNSCGCVGFWVDKLFDRDDTSCSDIDDPGLCRLFFPFGGHGAYGYALPHHAAQAIQNYLEGSIDPWEGVIWPWLQRASPS